MAIYHLYVAPVSRKAGESIVAGAAYRSASLLYEESTGITHDYRPKQGVEYSAILAPDGAPNWVHDRETLWNAVDKVETRKDAQLGRQVEIGLPIELTKAENIALLRDFTQRTFVSKGMVADIALHGDNPANPHAHILLTTRHLTETGFGYKNRDWNAKSEFLTWRRDWADITNQHLMDAGLAVRIDHRSYKAQQLDLIPGRKIGVSQQRQQSPDLPPYIADRVAEQQRIAGANGLKIIEEPTIALKALSQQNATFSHQDLAKFLHTRTENAEQFQTAYLKVANSAELVHLGTDDLGRQRFTTREMFDSERRLFANADTLARRNDHTVNVGRRARILAKHTLSAEQQRAAIDITGQGDLKSLAGVAGSGKSTTLTAMREIWEAEGYTVKGAALAGIAAQNLETAAGIRSRTLASYELAWSRGRDTLSRRDILVIDEAGMLGTRQLEGILAAAEKAKAKVVLVGDAEQLQAIEAGAAFRGISSTHGVSNLTEVRRQTTDWQRAATQDLSAGHTAAALDAYDRHHNIVQVESRAQARSALIARHAHDHKLDPTQSQLVMAFTRDDVKALNHDIRALRQQTGQLGLSEEISTESGKRQFALNDRIRFLKNERDLGVKNGSLGIIQGIESGVLSVQLDTGTTVQVDTKFYNHLDYGYAATVHKAQGTTVDKAYVLATSHFDRHTAYVALSRHRDNATVFYANDDFGGRARGATEQSVKARFTDILSRARPKELAHDYLELETGSPADRISRLGLEEEGSGVAGAANQRWQEQLSPMPTLDISARQQAAAERWAERQKAGPTPGQGTAPSNSKSPDPSQKLDRELDLRLDGPEDELEL